MIKLIRLILLIELLVLNSTISAQFCYPEPSRGAGFSLKTSETYLPPTNSSKINKTTDADSSYEWFWNEVSNTWEICSKQIFTRDEKKKIINKSQKYWIKSSQEYMGAGRWVETKNILRNALLFKNIFDSNMNIISCELHLWGLETKSWVITDKSVSTFDIVKNSKTTKICQKWDKTSKDWLNYSKGIYQYDINKKIKNEVFQDWEYSIKKWVNNSQYSYVYDAKNNLTNRTVYNWDNSVNAWVKCFQSTAIYGATNLNMGGLYQYWNKSSKAWVTSDKCAYSYDANMNITKEIYQKWDYSSKSLINSSKSSYIYDSIKNTTTQVFQAWVKEKSVWKNEVNHIYIRHK